MNHIFSKGIVKDRGFTLIEMLTVIAIIAVLIGLLFPAISGALRKSEIAQARADVKAIETALKQYYTEYGKLPVRDADQGIPDEIYDAATATYQYQIINTLRAIDAGDNAAHALNPRRIVFLDTPSRKGAIDASGNFVDPWNQVYYIKLDNNYDGQIANDPPYSSGPAETIASSALVISYGPNGIPDNPAAGGDDVVNYK
jgi:prepilin-type N-terminal cleavage/methylation domain-containing protein